MAATRSIAFVLLSVGYGIALWHGQLETGALWAFGLLVMAAVAVRPQQRQWVRRSGHGLFIVTGLALALHLLPGFNNAPIMPLSQSSEQAQPFITYLNLDKPLIGFWILLACPWAWRRCGHAHSFKIAIPALLLTPLLCLTLACLLGITGWAPTWPPYATLWLINNLLLVCLTEELLFRVYLQGALQHICHHWSLKGILPVIIASLLFGLAHIGGGWAWVLLASLAGFGYGIAWRFGGLWAAVIGHFALNMAHFALLTYPMLKQ